MRASTRTGFGLAVVMMGLLAFGCSTQTDDERSDGATTAQPSAKETGGPAGSTGSAALDRGLLVRTVATSERTKATTGVQTWALFTKNDVVTMYGFDAKGAVRAQVAAATLPDGSEMKIGAPGAGVLHVKKDGTVLSNTLVPSRIAGLSAMREDSAAIRAEAAYSLCDGLPFDFDDMLGFIGPGDCEADFWCPPPRPYPSPCTRPLPELCAVVCPVGTSLGASCECVGPGRGWDAWEN